MAITGCTDLGDGLSAMTVDHDPRVTVTDVLAGSIIIYVGTDGVGIRHGDIFKKLDDGSTTNVSELSLKNSFSETTDPGSSNDNTQDYQVGSRWINVTLDKEFVCLDASTGAAVWADTTQAGAAITYAEGGFTPIAVFTGGSGTITYITQQGRYTRIGRMVFFEIYLRTSSIASRTGTMKIGGLPFTSLGSPYGTAHFGHANAVAIGVGQALTGNVDISATTIQLNLWDAATGISALLASEWSDSGQAYISGQYMI